MNDKNSDSGNTASIELDKETMHTLIDTLRTLEMAKGYVNDQMLSDLSRILASMFKLINAVSSTDMVDIIERGMQDPDLDRALMEARKANFIALLKAMSDPDVQRGLGIMLALLKAIGKASAEQSKVWKELD